MSNSLAIAAVTATLSSLLTNGLRLDPEILGATVTTKAPDKARNGDQTGNQLNVFLYHVEHNATWHDSPMPGQGPDAPAPLAINLYYLLTAYGEGDDDVKGHHLLGRGMRTLFDTPTLQREDIKTALQDNDLHEQVERVQITRQPMTLDEMSKLWSTFQSNYRISVAYQVSVVLIESQRGARASLPILRRGSEDRGVISQPDTVPPFPTIEDREADEPVVILPGGQPAGHLKRTSAQLGDILQFKGHHLSGADVKVRFSNPRLRVVSNPPAEGDHPLESEEEAIVEAQSNDSLVTVQLPDNAAKYPAGVYTVAVVVTDPKTVDGQVFDDQQVSNELAVGIAPEIIRNPVPNPPQPLVVNRALDGTVTINLRCKPEVRPEQRVSLFLGSREIPAQAHPNQTNQLTFRTEALMDGTYLMRLRVDGVDSISITEKAGKLIFDPNQKVTVQ